MSFYLSGFPDGEKGCPAPYANSVSGFTYAAMQSFASYIERSPTSLPPRTFLRCTDFTAPHFLRNGLLIPTKKATKSPSKNPAKNPTKNPTKKPTLPRILPKESYQEPYRQLPEQEPPRESKQQTNGLHSKW